MLERTKNKLNKPNFFVPVLRYMCFTKPGAKADEYWQAPVNVCRNTLSCTRVLRHWKLSKRTMQELQGILFVTLLFSALTQSVVSVFLMCTRTPMCRVNVSDSLWSYVLYRHAMNVAEPNVAS